MPVAKTLNGNIICSIGLKVTGNDPIEDEIYQLCFLPLDKNLNPMSNKLFERTIEVRRLNQEKIKQKSHIMPREPYRVYDEFEMWFEETLKEGQVLPLTYDWQVNRRYIERFFNPLGYELFFHKTVRDIKNIATYLNDLTESNDRIPLPFPKDTFRYVANNCYVDLSKDYTALEMAKVTAECYKKMVNQDLANCLLSF